MGLGYIWLQCLQPPIVTPCCDTGENPPTLTWVGTGTCLGVCSLGASPLILGKVFGDLCLTLRQVVTLASAFRTKREKDLCLQHQDSNHCAAAHIFCWALILCCLIFCFLMQESQWMAYASCISSPFWDNTNSCIYWTSLFVCAAGDWSSLRQH